MNKTILAIKPGIVALLVLMVATRFHHFGTAFSLPDASLAVFFLAGLWFGGRYLFITLLVAAGLIDYLAINGMGVSDYCVSPAYVFLIPTYAALWLAGKWCAKFNSFSLPVLLQQFTALVTAVCAAFIISNGSFLLFSGKTQNTGWEQYFDSLVNYFPPYLLATLVYSVVIFALVNGLKLVVSHNASDKTIY